MGPLWDRCAMKANILIATTALAAIVAGCSSADKPWPWHRDEGGVPVTRPTTEDANALAAIAARPPASQPAPTAPTPRPAKTPPAKPTPGAARQLLRPTPLTDVLRWPAPATQPVAVAVATRPATSRPAGPESPAGIAPLTAPIGRTMLAVGEKPTPTGPERVVAASAIQVNNRFVTVDDIVRRIKPRLAKVPKTLTPQKFAQRVSPWIAEQVRERINQALVLDEANKRLVDEQKKIIDAEVAEAKNAMLAEAGGSITRLKHELAKDGTTLEQVLTVYREDAAFRFYLRSRFMPAIVITRKMLWDYYRIHNDEFSADKKVQMQIIAAPYNRFLPENVTNPSATELAAARTAARTTIDQALAALAKGEDFGAVARKFSRGIKAPAGGVWPLMAIDTFRETAVEKRAFQLDAGNTAGPIETKHGLYLVKVRRVEPGRVVPFTEAQQTITETLRNRMYLDLTEKYFRDLYDKAHIEQSKDFDQHVLRRLADLHFGT